jgi:hypothetical protein
MYNPFVSFFSPETLMLSHYLKFPEVFSEYPRPFCACLRSSVQRKADVNDASFSNLFPINTVLTSRRLGFVQKRGERKKKPQENADGSGRTAEKLAEQSYTVHIPLTYE